MPACESPIRATLVGDAVSPEEQSGTAMSFQDRTQPLTNTSGLVMLPSGGERFEGTACSSADVATAACICCSGVSTAVGAAAAGGPTKATGTAAGPDAVGTGRTAKSTSPAQTAVAVAVAPTARLRHDEPRSAVANRAGFSTRCRVKIAKPNDITIMASRPASPRP